MAALQLQGLPGTPLAQEGAGEAEQGSGPQGGWRLALQAGHQGFKQLGGLIGVTEQLQGLGLVQGALEGGGRIARQPVELAGPLPNPQGLKGFSLLVAQAGLGMERLGEGATVLAAGGNVGPLQQLQAGGDGLAGSNGLTEVVESQREVAEHHRLVEGIAVAAKAIGGLLPEVTGLAEVAAFVGLARPLVEAGGGARGWGARKSS